MNLNSMEALWDHKISIRNAILLSGEGGHGHRRKLWFRIILYDELVPVAQ